MLGAAPGHSTIQYLSTYLRTYLRSYLLVLDPAFWFLETSESINPGADSSGKRSVVNVRPSWDTQKGTPAHLRRPGQYEWS